MKDLLYSEISSEGVCVMELPERQYALDIRSPFQLLQANLDGLRWYIDNMINFEAGLASKYRERFVPSNELHSYFSKDAKLDFACKLGNNTLVHEEAELGGGTRITNAVVLRGAKVAGHCSLNRVLLASNCRVAAHCVLKNVCVGNQATVGAHCKLSNVLLDSEAHVADGERLENINIKQDGTRVALHGKAETNRMIMEDDFELFDNMEEEENLITVEPGRASLS